MAEGQQLLSTKLDELSHGAATAKAGADQISDGVNQLGSQMQNLVDGLTQARDLLNEVGTSVGDGRTQSRLLRFPAARKSSNTFYRLMDTQHA